MEKEFEKENNIKIKKSFCSFFSMDWEMDLKNRKISLAGEDNGVYDEGKGGLQICSTKIQLYPVLIRTHLFAVWATIFIL